VPSRRELLCSFGPLAAAVAGCSDDDEPGPGLYASNAQVIHRAGDDRLDYPEDVLVRVTVENTTPDRQSGTLQTRLERLEDTGGTPAVAQFWTKERDINITRGTSRPYFVLFEQVLGEDEEEPSLRARADILASNAVE